MKLVDAIYDADEWALVPKKPTKYMINDAAIADDEGFEAGRSHGASAQEIYQAMILARPCHPSIRDHVEDKLVSIEKLIELAKNQGWAMKSEVPFEDAVRAICDLLPKDKP